MRRHIVRSRIILTLSSILFLAGCASTRQIDVATTPTELRIYQPARPAPVKLNNVKFRVVTKENLDQFIAEQAKKQGNSNPVFVVISTKDYETLSLNLAELKRYIDQQREIIVYYEGATASK